MAIGVFDRGLGRLTVHRAISQLMPDLPLQYYSDNAHASCGKHVLSVFVPMIEVLTQRDWNDNSPPLEGTVRQVALFATAATVTSRAFQRELST